MTQENTTPAESAVEQTTALTRIESEKGKALKQIEGLLDARRPTFEQILPKGMTPERFVRVTVLAVAKNPELLECTRESLVMAIIEAAEVGLEPTGQAGGAHLVPFRDNKAGVKKVQLIHDYTGTQALIRRGGGGEVVAQAVFEGDVFDVLMGTRPQIIHKPAFTTQDPIQMTHVYAWSVDTPEKFEVMTKAQIDGIRARAKAANKGPWVTDYVQMARKTVIKRLSKYLPLSAEARAAILRDEEREFGAEPTPVETVRRTATVREVLRAQLAPPPEEAVTTPDESATEQTAAAEEPQEA